MIDHDLSRLITSSAGGVESVWLTAIWAHIRSWSGKVLIIRSIVTVPFWKLKLTLTPPLAGRKTVYAVGMNSSFNSVFSRWTLKFLIHIVEKVELSSLTNFELFWDSRTFKKIIKSPKKFFTSLDVSFQESTLKVTSSDLSVFRIDGIGFFNVLEYQNGSKFVRRPNSTYFTIWIKKTWGSEKVGNSLFSRSVEKILQKNRFYMRTDFVPASLPLLFYTYILKNLNISNSCRRLKKTVIKKW